MTLLVATRDFIDPTDPSAIERGKTYCRPEADVVRRFPDRFEPVPQRLVGSSSQITRMGGASTLVDRPRAAGREIEFRERSPFPLTIRLDPQARRQIEDEIDWCGVNGRAFPDHGFRETGGYLYSRNRPRLDRVELVLASGPGPDSLHGYAELRRSEVERIEEELFRERPRELFWRTACWHSHPTVHDTPSETDMLSWAARSKAAGPLLSGWASLIVCPTAEGGWTLARFSAFATRHDGARWICERAEVVETGCW